jgi:arsenate reductase
MTTKTPTILFLCHQNAARSVIGQAMLRARLGHKVISDSAGIAPLKEIKPLAKTVLEERGFNVSNFIPKTLTPEIAKQADVIVSMGCDRNNPLFQGKNVLSWTTPDAQNVETMRNLAEVIDGLVDGLVIDLKKQTIKL